MPNWCDNNLCITGPKDQLQKFKVTANGPVASYNDFHPIRGEWPINDDIRLKAMAETMPEPGPVSVFSFHALFPVPDEVRKMPYDCNRAKEIGERLGKNVTQGGYGWEVENWGCKWGASEPSLDDSNSDYLHYAFDTPWGPPLSFIEKISKDWPELSFEVSYSEPGMAFEGKALYLGGEEEFHDEWQMEFDDEEDDE